jgi:SEC-C motif domain protein
MHKKKSASTTCLCGSGLPYVDCCARWHNGELYLQAPSAEHLMRSRYVAFAMGLEQYLLDSWHERYRPYALNLSAELNQYLSLRIVKHVQLNEYQAQVAFEIKMKLNGKVHYTQELSLFLKMFGTWFYVKEDIENKHLFF